MNNLKRKKFSMTSIYKFFSLLVALVFGLLLIPLKTSAVVKVRRLSRTRLSYNFATSNLTKNHLGVSINDPCILSTKLEDDKKHKKTSVKRCLKNNAKKAS